MMLERKCCRLLSSRRGVRIVSRAQVVALLALDLARSMDSSFIEIGMKPAHLGKMHIWR